eukprot:TRINITY_DN30305_c0_g1_i1.p1 TRINITY_DN30305_c0_g1~~TRINITY_DN30305_c0_g1_i1.p1  ORF type:complete len:328 (+),score=71.65 TRINITY_DN30305_c0_g1_i1:51-986(+)
MQWYGILGSGLIAWSPAAAVLFGGLGKHPQLVMIGVAACFFFVVASHVCAVIWHAIPPLKDTVAFHAIVGVVVTELFRFAFFKVYDRVEAAFGKRFGEVVYLTEFGVVPAGLAAGVGWGVSQSLLSFGIIFSYHTDPTVTGPNATWYSDDCKSIPVLFLQALQSLFYSLCNMAWMVTAFAAYHSIQAPSSPSLPYQKMGRTLPPPYPLLLLPATYLLHLSASLFTLVTATPGGCQASMPLLALVTVISSCLAIYTTRLVHATPPPPETPLPKPGSTSSPLVASPASPPNFGSVENYASPEGEAAKDDGPLE